MITRTMLRLAAVMVTMVGCVNQPAEDTTANPVHPAPEDELPTEAEAERPALTNAECAEQGGVVVGDIGDGAIHRPDYTCESGEPPLGDIRPGEGEPIAVEGSVCCPS